MKRLIIFSILLIVSVGLFAQDRIVERTLSPDQTLYDYTGQDADTLGTTVDTMAFVFNVNKNRPVLHNIEFKSDVVSAIDGTYEIDVKLQGRTFTSDSWSDIDATNTGNDATGAITLDFTSDLSEVLDTSATTTHPYYRQFRLLVANNTVSGLDAGEQHKVEYIYVKFYER
jgi:hypothetical protein